MSTYKQVKLEIMKEIKAQQAMMKETMRKEGYNMQKQIIKGFYSATSGSVYGLARRTGAAAKSWQVVVNRGDKFSVSVFSAGVPYADMSEEKTIVPKEKKWLAIPVGAALTARGAPRYPNGPRQAAMNLTMRPVQHGFRKQNPKGRDPLRFYKKDSNTAFLIAKDGVRGTGLNKKNRILFVLKKKVKRPAKTKLLMPWVDRRLDSMFEKIAGFK